VPEVDRDRLSFEERREYQRRRTELAPAVTERWAARDRLVRRIAISGAGVGAACFVVGLIGGLEAVYGVGLGMALLALYLWFMVSISLDGVRGRRQPRILACQASDYLSEIGYAERPDPRPAESPSSADGGPNYYATGGQYDPEAFGRIRRSHSQYELDAMRDHGMSADEWDANRPD